MLYEIRTLYTLISGIWFSLTLRSYLNQQEKHLKIDKESTKSR